MHTTLQHFPTPAPAKSLIAHENVLAHPTLNVKRLLIAILSLAMALYVSGGKYHPPGLVLLTVSIVACAFAVVTRGSSRVDSSNEIRLQILLGAGLALELTLVLITPPGIYLNDASLSGRMPFLIGAGTLVALTAGLFVCGRRGANVLFATIVGIQFLMGAWVIRASPAPSVDVWTHQQEACRALLSGHNPYSITVSNIYANNPEFYGPGMTDGDRVTFGLAYPPASLLLVLPAYVIGGDVRYATLVAMGLTAILLALIDRRGSMGKLIGLLYLFVPTNFFVIEQAWTEPLVILLLTACVWCALRHRNALWVGLGLLVGVKQYLIVFAPLLWIVKDRLSGERSGWKWTRPLIGAVLLAGSIAFPFVVWDAKAFVHSTISTHFNSPFRMDSLSYAALFAHLTGHAPPKLLGFLVLGPALLVALYRSPKSPAGFAWGISLVAVAFFAFSKQAFCNYYLLPIGGICCAIVASLAQRETENASN